MIIDSVCNTKARFEKAEAYAATVWKGGDIQVIDDIIKKTEEYGADQVARAFGIVSIKSADNPKRSYKYVVGILQKEARNKGASIEIEE